MTAAARAARTAAADDLCAAAYRETGCPDTGVALIAVGGYGRRELAPHSDLDIVLVHDPGVRAGPWAGELWYPLWDSGPPIDHAVRSVPEILELIAADLRVAMGLLDVRHLAGDPNLTLRLRSAVLTDWRRHTRMRLPELHELVLERGRRTGELAHAAVPDLKQSVGGLRDATALKALVASWLVEVPHGTLESCRAGLLDVRDALHQVAGRSTDRVLPEYWEPIAEVLALKDGRAAQLHTRRLARRLTHVSRLAWRRARTVSRRPPPGPRRPRLERVAPGVAASGDEIVLDAGARPDRDALLLFRISTLAAERNLVLSPASAGRLARESPDLSTGWPQGALALFVRLLGSGPGLLPVWETLEETGALERVLPEWSAISLLPHASSIHRFTVDRHLVETCIEASRMLRRVTRTDLLLVAALLHDIGKGGGTDHAVAGAPLAVEVAVRMGFGPADAATVGDLVRWHLLLPTLATRRDLDDPATIEEVVHRVPDRETLALLHVLVVADARATSDAAWTTWRASLVEALVRRVHKALQVDGG